MLLLPNNKPTVPGGRGPKIPVGKACIPISGVNTILVVEHKSNPALPEVARNKSVMYFLSEARSLSVPVVAPVSEVPHNIADSGPEAGPSPSFPERVFHPYLS